MLPALLINNPLKQGLKLCELCSPTLAPSLLINYESTAKRSFLEQFKKKVNL